MKSLRQWGQDFAYDCYHQHPYKEETPQIFIGLHSGNTCSGLQAPDSAYYSPSLTDGEIVICGIEAGSHSWHCYCLAHNRQVLCMQHVNPS